MFAHALQSARVVLQAEDLFTSNPSRDLYVAENASWLLEQAGSEVKIVLWAHNGHISKIGDVGIVRLVLRNDRMTIRV
jgi:erythromycin esterase-like protein